MSRSLPEMKGEPANRPYKSHWRQMATENDVGGEAKPDEDVAPRQCREGLNLPAVYVGVLGLLNHEVIRYKVILAICTE